MNNRTLLIIKHALLLKNIYILELKIMYDKVKLFGLK